MIKKTLLALLILVLIAQFIRPDKNESGYESVAFFEKETQPTGEVQQLLSSNCYDCHSNQTTYPWYAEITPVNFWLDHHIEEGNQHFNVSNWAAYSTKKKDHKLEEFIEEVEKGEMPLDSYTWLHGNLSNDEKGILIDWIKNLRNQYTVE